MVRVRYTADGGHFRIARVGFDPGDVRDVDAELAAYLADHEDFEVLEELDEVPREADEPPDDTAASGDDAASSEEADSGGFDIDTWLEQDYGDRAEQVRAGDVDAHLEEIAETERSNTVLDAIGERRAELEG